MEQQDGLSELVRRGASGWGLEAWKGSAPTLHPPLPQGYWSNSWGILSSTPSHIGTKEGK